MLTDKQKELIEEIRRKAIEAGFKEEPCDIEGLLTFTKPAEPISLKELLPHKDYNDDKTRETNKNKKKSFFRKLAFWKS